MTSYSNLLLYVLALINPVNLEYQNAPANNHQLPRRNMTSAGSLNDLASASITKEGMVLDTSVTQGCRAQIWFVSFRSLFCILSDEVIIYTRCVPSIETQNSSLLTLAVIPEFKSSIRNYNARSNFYNRYRASQLSQIW